MKARQYKKYFLLLLCLVALAIVALAGWRKFREVTTRTDLTPRHVTTETMDGGRLELGHAVLRPNLPSNQTVELFYAIPLDVATGEVHPTASTVLFCAPFLNEDRFLKRDGLRDDYVYFARHYGWSLFTLAITGDRSEDEEGHSNYYVYPETGWPEVVFAVKSWLEERYGLTSKPLVLLGESSGGSMSEQLAVTYPDRIAAAAWNGGTTYQKLQPDFALPLFAFNTWGCPGAAESRSLARHAARLGLQVLWEEGPPIWSPFDNTHHGVSPLANQLRRLYLKGVMDLADADGHVPPPETWPVTFSMPDGRQLRFPSEAFRQCWEQLPLELNATLRGEIRRSAILLKPTGADTPTRTVCFLPGDLDYTRLRDVVYAFQCDNCNVVVSLPDPTSDEPDNSRMEAIHALLRENPKLSSVPLLVLGRDTDTMCALELANALLKNGSTVKELLLDEPEWSFDQLPTELFRKFAQNGAGLRLSELSAPLAEGLPGSEELALPDPYAEEAEWLTALQNWARAIK